MLHVAVGPGLRRDDGTGDERFQAYTTVSNTVYEVWDLASALPAYGKLHRR